MIRSSVDSPRATRNHERPSELRFQTFVSEPDSNGVTAPSLTHSPITVSNHDRLRSSVELRALNEV